MYVLGLKNNLVSISTLEDKGMRVFFRRGKVLTWPMESRTRDAFTLVSRIEGLYRVNGRPLLAMVHDINHQSDIWNQRLAHVWYEALSKLNKFFSGMFDVQDSHDGVCSWCANRKKKLGSFPSSKNKTDGILQLIHFDICGPMPVHSLGGLLYYIIFIDELFRRKWIFYLKHKDEAFDMLKDFKVLIENQTRKKIKVFMSDNGGEYTSNEFIEF